MRDELYGKICGLLDENRDKILDIIRRRPSLDRY